MELYTISDWGIFLVSGFHSGFTVLTILCLMAEWLMPKGMKRKEVMNFHSAVNLALAIGVTLELLLWSRIYIEMYRQRSLYESYTTLPAGFTIEKIFFISTILFWIGALLFYIRRLRISRLISFLVLLLANAEFIIPWIGEWMGEDVYSYTLYEFTAWDKLIQVSLFIGFTGLLYWYLARMDKLPYTKVRG